MNELGITTKKSLILKEIVVPDEFFGDFLRGVIDGDGYVSILKSRKGQIYHDLRVGICSASFDFINSLNKKINSFGIKTHFRFDDKNRKNRLYSITIVEHKSLNKLYKLIYNDSKNFMRRKRNNFEKWISIDRDMTIKNRKIFDKDIDHMRELFNNGLNALEISKNLNMKHSTVQKYLKLNGMSQNIKWTQEEDNIIYKNIDKTYDDLISLLKNRSFYAVQNRVRKIKNARDYFAAKRIRDGDSGGHKSED